MFKKNYKRAKNIENLWKALFQKITDKHNPVLERKSKTKGKLPKTEVSF